MFIVPHKTQHISSKHLTFQAILNKAYMNKIRVDKKNQLDVIFVFFISLLIVAQHVSGNHVPIIRS